MSNTTPPLGTTADENGEDLTGFETMGEIPTELPHLRSLAAKASRTKTISPDFDQYTIKQSSGQTPRLKYNRLYQQCVGRRALPRSRTSRAPTHCRYSPNLFSLGSTALRDLFPYRLDREAAYETSCYLDSPTALPARDRLYIG